MVTTRKRKRKKKRTTTTTTTTLAEVLTCPQGSIKPGASIPLHVVDYAMECIALFKIYIKGFDWSNSITIEPLSNPQPLKLLDEKKRPLNLFANMNYGRKHCQE